MFGFPQSISTGRVGRDFQEFQSTGVANSWQTWQKPQGCNHAFMICIGGGSSGAGGQTGAAGTARSGGGGGGSGAIARLYIPLIFLPDVLYIQVGLGGASVAANTNGNAGNRSFISTAPLTSNAAYLVLVSGSAAAAAPTTTGGTGAAETVATIALTAYANLGLWAAIAGQAGAAGGANTGAIGGAITPLGYTSGGAGGGGTPTANTDFAGGAINAVAAYPSIAGGTAAGGFGSSGFFQLNPMFTFGGTGGGTNGAAGTGGDGGAGGIGSGGGGGGAGVTGGRGGRGGNGYVMIACW